MVNPIRLDVSIAKIDLSDTRLKFRRNFKDEAIKKKAKSIHDAGLLNPVKLWKHDDRYTVIAGWQRIMAIISLGCDTITADVYEGITFEEAVRINIADNHLREDLSDYETACQMQSLSQYEHYPVEKLADLFGCGVDRVYDMLSIFSMDEELRYALEKGRLTLYRAVVISRFPASERSEILEKTLREGRSVKWLKQELAKLKRHPFYNWRPPADTGPTVPRHALRIPLSKSYLDISRAFYEMIGKSGGLPGPHKCEFTLSTFAQRCNPPYVCDHDAEWVVLAYGKFPHGDVHDFDWEEVPIEERDGWFFYCERCAQLVFPDIVFHRGTSYHAWYDEESTVEDDGLTYPFED